MDEHGLNMKSEIALVVFDMAGTTVRDDDAVNRCLQTALAAGGVQVTRDEVNAVMGRPKPEAIAALWSQKRGTGAAPAEVTRLHDNFLRAMIEFYRTDAGVGEVPGASGLFRQLHEEGIAVALDTGFSREIVDVILQRLGWDLPGVLDATVASDEVRRGHVRTRIYFSRR